MAEEPTAKSAQLCAVCVPQALLLVKARSPRESQSPRSAKVRDAHRICKKSRASGRLAVTAIDSLEWFNASPADAQARMLKSAGIDAERERAVLAAWHASKR